MRKDIEWLKNKVLISKETYMTMRDNSEPHSGSRRFYNGMLNSASLILDFINKLDEPEVLSEEWINKNKEDSGVHYIGYYVPIGRLFDLIIPKQELPVIPQWVADSIESKKKVGTRLNVAMSEFPEFRLEKELDINEYECNELYARAWLDGYEVKEEQKYVIKLPMSTNRDMDFALVDDKGDIWVDAYPSKYKLTEQEILSLPKGDVYFKYFSEPVEERE